MSTSYYVICQQDISYPRGTLGWFATNLQFHEILICAPAKANHYKVMALCLAFTFAILKEESLN